MMEEENEVNVNGTEDAEPQDAGTDFSKYEKNLGNENSEETELSKMKDLLDKQDSKITELKTEIKTLKELNMQLALNGKGDAQPLNAVDALNEAFKRV